MPVKIKRVYDQPDNSDGLRVLVDRLWPRGLSKDKACIDLWAKEVAPSSDLRKWFAHRKDRWEAFQRRYRVELAENAALDELCAKSEKDTVTLLYGARDPCINHARVLAAVIAERSSCQTEVERSDEMRGGGVIATVLSARTGPGLAWNGKPRRQRRTGGS
nr:DUF488 family protein [Marinicella sp. W31]MDC2880302.1 DUF488 family protein [Marinicella sp. W31]